jgi:uncharacterized iron-regulated membrane protein
VLTVRKVKLWYRVHKWSSLICTAFLLMLCVTGLPLIFHHEIDHLLGNEVAPPAMPAGTPLAPLDRVVEAAKAQRPGDVVHYVFYDPDDPDVRLVSMAPAIDSPPDDSRFVAVDARTAQVLNEPDLQGGLVAFLLELHTDMFLELPGKLFLGFMGLLFVIAIVSGVAVYGPFMRKLEFGTVRRQKSNRLKWLDLHNLLGIVTLTWALVVGATGMINTWADLVVKLWQFDQLADMTAPYRGKPPATNLVSVDLAVATAQNAVPNMTPSFVAFPGWMLTSPHHYGIFMRGKEPFTARLLKPVLVDAETAALTDMRDMPWYVTTLLVSQPLHFGDYGGMPMKIIWALLDVATIIVLGSGLYLWAVRRRTPFEARLAEIERETVAAQVALPRSPV